jgi:hypothetical protein
MERKEIVTKEVLKETNGNGSNGWTVWSKFVLKELERLNIGQDKITEVISNLPCGVNKTCIDNLSDKLDKIENNDLKHINIKINAMLFTVCGSVVITLLVLGIKAAFSVMSGGI